MKTWVITRFTLRETLRSRTMVTGLVVSLLYLALVPMISSPSSGNPAAGELGRQAEAGRAFLEFAMGGLNFIGMIMAILTALGSIYSGIERGTFAVVVTKPIRRSQLVLGTWLGHVLLMTGYVLAMGTALWLSVALGSGTIVWSFIPAVLLICLNVTTMLTLTMMFSTFTPVIANGIFVFIIFILSSNLRVINTVSEASSNLFVTAAALFLRLLLPVGEVSGVVGSLIVGDPVSGAWSIPYELLYIGALVALAIFIFGRRDLN